MSALTDLFTSLATKIRSKVGGTQTYTPAQMVSAIDDVYQAGVDAGETPTQTKTVTAGTSATTVTPDAGYALSSVTVNPTPSQSKSATPTTSAQTITPDSGKLLSSVSVGAIQTQTKSATPTTSAQTVTPDSGKYLSQVNVGAIPSDYVIPTSITPSNTSPASMASGGAYKPSSSGYAISSYDSVTPSSSGTYFSSGMKKMASSGYAYSSQPQMTETTLWTNPSPSTAIGGTTVTLSQSMRNFDYIKFIARLHKNTDIDVTVIYKVSDFVETEATSVADSIHGVWFVCDASKNRGFRTFYYASDTSVYFYAGSYYSSSGTSLQTTNNVAIPKQIIGMKL